MEAAGSTNFHSTFSDNATGVIKAGSKCIRRVEAENGHGPEKKCTRHNNNCGPDVNHTVPPQRSKFVSFDKSDYLLRLLLTTSSG